jgi:hypothetical protein
MLDQSGSADGLPPRNPTARRPWTSRRPSPPADRQRPLPWRGDAVIDHRLAAAAGALRFDALTWGEGVDRLTSHTATGSADPRFALPPNPLAPV